MYVILLCITLGQMHKSDESFYICMHVYIYTHTNTHIRCENLSIHVCMYVCRHVYTHQVRESFYTCMCMYVCRHVYTHQVQASFYTCTYVCIHVYTHQVRQELYYTPQWGERQRAMNLSYNAWGPPIPLMFFTFCIESCANAALEASNQTVTQEQTVTFGPIGWCKWLRKKVCAWWAEASGVGRTRARQIARLVYAIKLSGKLVACASQICMGIFCQADCVIGVCQQAVL